MWKLLLVLVILYYICNFVHTTIPPSDVNIIFGNICNLFGIWLFNLLRNWFELYSVQYTKLMMHRFTVKFTGLKIVMLTKMRYINAHVNSRLVSWLLFILYCILITYLLWQCLWRWFHQNMIAPALMCWWSRAAIWWAKLTRNIINLISMRTFQISDKF